jgi:ATP-dependent RNA helicase DeaD
MPSRASKNAETGFASLGLDARLLDALIALGYEEPTPIQVAAIPPLLAGRDVLAVAATGTGKTAAFTLPLLHGITPSESPRARLTALVLVPTRELAMQVAEAVHRYGKSLGVAALPVYGGASMEVQIRALRRGVDVVIATPGRALDHLRRGTLHLDAVRTVVLDEADEMLDMGFAEDIETILAAAPKDRQTALFSATIPPRIATIADAHLRDPEIVRLDREPVAADGTAKVRQIAYIVPRAQKAAALARVLDVEAPASAIVFCRTRTEVDELTEVLLSHGYRAAALHGGLSQDQRDRVMKRFRAKSLELLIATDVAARGLDVRHVTHVVNYDVPSAPSAYVHRIGRTGRAGDEGVAITLAESREHRLLRSIEFATKQKIEIGTLPTFADLQMRRLETLRASLRETIAGGSLESYRSVVEQLAQEYDLMDVAAAAVKQAATRAEEAATPPVDSFASKPEHGGRAERRGRGDGDERRERSAGAGARAERSHARARPVKPLEMTKLFISAGKKLKIRPGDIVGAIAGESGIDSDLIGAVTVSDRHTVVEVPEEFADSIVSALSASTLRGNKVKVRRDRDTSK